MERIDEIFISTGINNLLVLENDDGFSYDYQKVGLNNIILKFNVMTTSWLTNLLNTKKEEIEEILSTVDAVYVNSNIINHQQYAFMMELILSKKNIKVIFFADWYFEVDGSTFKRLIEDRKCRVILNEIKSKGVSFFITTRTPWPVVYALKDFSYDHPLNKYFINTEMIFDEWKG